MKILEFEDYENYYIKHGKTIDQIAKPKTPLTQKALLIKFNNYYKKELAKAEKASKKVAKKKAPKVDEKWLEVKKEVKARDGEGCQLIKRLREEGMEEELAFLAKQNPGLLNTIDPAHVLRKTKDSSLYYNVEDIVSLNRVSHSWIDSGSHPVYGTKITKQEEKDWWIFIIGSKRYNRLVQSIEK